MRIRRIEVADARPGHLSVNLRPAVEAKLVEPERYRYAGEGDCVDVGPRRCVRRHRRAAFRQLLRRGETVRQTLFFDYHRRPSCRSA